MAKRNVLLGDFLIAQGLITDAQLHSALKYQKEKGKRLGSALIDLDILSEKEMIKALSEQLGVQYVSLKNYRIDPAVIKLVPEHVARHFQVLPLFRIDTTLTVGMVNPLDVVAIDAISRACHLKVEPLVCSEIDMREAIEQYYGSADHAANDTDNRNFATVVSVDHGEERPRRQDEDPAIVKLAETIVHSAVRNNASHIHCDAGAEQLQVRYRIDGRLSVAMTPPHKMCAPLLAQFKLLAGLNGAAQGVPQHGRMHLQVDGRTIEAWLSTAPAARGENAVVHLCDRARAFRLEELGLSSVLLDTLKSFLQHAHGLFVVAGPAASGCTTTLYALLRALQSPDRSIVTLEDPVDQLIDGCRQIQISANGGMSLAEGFHTALHQDADVIMVSDLRDEETARLAVDAAVDGQLVLAALSASGASAAIGRLLDMGVKPYLLASGLRVVLAQRLVRKICHHCKVPEPASPEIMSMLPRRFEQPPAIYRGRGCPKCNGTGYHGRTVVCELLPCTEVVQSHIRSMTTAGAITTAFKENNVGSLFQDGIEKMLQGITTWEEILQVSSAT